jgi:hypothetical protein
MSILLSKLPNEIIRKIIPYTYNLQKTDLLQDIIHFAKQRNLIYYIYNETYGNEYKEWLLNDLLLFCNDYYGPMFGYNDTFYNILYRNKLLLNQKQINHYIHLLERKNINIIINTLYGLLTVKERYQFLNNWNIYSF